MFRLAVGCQGCHDVGYNIQSTNSQSTSQDSGSTHDSQITKVRIGKSTGGIVKRITATVLFIPVEMEAKRGQRIHWNEPEVSTFPAANGFHSKVNRTCSISLGVLPPAGLLSHLSINRRSSPDGSAAASADFEPGLHLSTTTTPNDRKQIDERVSALSTTATGLRYNDAAVKETEEVNGPRSPSPLPPVSTVAAGQPSPSTPVITQPYLGQNGDDDDACSASGRDMEPSLLDLDASDAMYSPVASESRGELLKYEGGGGGGSVALEDVLRHYWLLSDRDDELPKSRDGRSSSSVTDDSTTSFDWNPKRSDVNGAYRSQPPGPSDWTARGPEMMLPLDCDDDDDVDSVVTLSTISEEDEDDLSEDDSSVTRISRNGEKDFCDTSRDVVRDDDVKYDVTDSFDDEDIDFLSTDKEDFDVRSDLSAETDKVGPILEQRSPAIGLSEDDLLPSSSSMMDSFVRSFSGYVSDIFPFSPAFVSQDSNALVGEGTACRTKSDLSVGDGTAPAAEYTVTDTLVHIKLLSTFDETDHSRHKDQATNTLADDRSEMVWSPCDARNSITSPTSWYTVSDIFNSQSFETASEMDDPSETTPISTANATCTAVARCLVVGQSSQPLELLPSSTVSVRVTAADDPFAAIGRATARAASQATSRAVRDFSEISDRGAADVVEVVVTTTCILTRMNDLELMETENNSADGSVFLLRNDASVEARSCAVDVATQSTNHNSSCDHVVGCSSSSERIRGIRFPPASGKRFRNAPAILNGSDFAEAAFKADDSSVEEWTSAVDEAKTGSGCACSVAIPCTGPDGDVRPQVREATYLPTTTGAAAANDGTPQDFEIISVALKEPARKRDIFLAEKTVRSKNNDRRADAYVMTPSALYTVLKPTRSLEKEKSCGGFQGSDKKTEDQFEDAVDHFSSVHEKHGDTTAATENKNSLKRRHIEKLPGTNHEVSHSVNLIPLLDISSECLEHAINTCDNCPSSGSAIAYNTDGKSTEKDPLTVESSSNSRQLCTERQKEDGNNGPASDDKNFDSRRETVGRHPETGSDILKRSFHSPFAQRQQVSDERNQKQNKYFRIHKSQSLLLETDIDTLEHRRTPVSRKGNRGSASSETKSCTDLTVTRVYQQKTRSSPLSFGRGGAGEAGDSLISKEALAEMLSGSARAGSFGKKQRNHWGPQTVAGHCLSEPTLQPCSPDNESTTSSNSAGSRTAGPGHLMERFSGEARWRMYRSQETVSARKQTNSSSSSPDRTDSGRVIERYEHSPSLRRRSLQIIETSLQRTQSSKTPPLKNLSSDSRGYVARHSSSPASSSFENLVDSLLGITTVMSLGAAAVSQTSSYVVIPSEQLKPQGGGGDMSPRNHLHTTVSETTPISTTQTDKKKIRFEMGSEVSPASQTKVPLGDISGSPLHASATTARKHVHFRKAKHIFRKCHFCIDANERKSGSSSPSKSPSHEPTRRKTSGKKHH